MVLGDGASGEVRRTRGGHEGGALVKKISALTRVLRAGFPLCSPLCGASSLHPGRGVSPEPDRLGTLSSDVQLPES